MNFPRVSEIKYLGINIITFRTFKCSFDQAKRVVFSTPPHRGAGYCIRTISFFLSFFVCLFLCLFLCQQHYEKTAGPICMKFSGKVWSDHGTTWFNFESIRLNGSAGRRSSCLLSPAIAQTSGELTCHCHSLGGSRGLALTSQLHRWQQGAGFVVPRTTACLLLRFP